MTSPCIACAACAYCPIHDRPATATPRPTVPLPTGEPYANPPHSAPLTPRPAGHTEQDPYIDLEATRR